MPAPAAPPAAPAPAPAAAAPAAAPAPAPSKPAAPAAAPPAPARNQSKAVSSKPVSNPAQNLADAYSQLDSLGADDGGGPAPEPRTPPKPPELPGGQKPQDAKDNKPPGETADDANPDNPEGASPKPGEKPDEKIPAKTLRERKDQLERENASLAARVKELEEKNSDPTEHPEFKKNKETLEQREKRLAELEEEIRFTNYERSTEYREKYEAPFLDAYAAGRAKVSSFTLTDPGTGEPRQGTEQDFDQLMRITDDNAAAERAAELFGNKAPIVLFHREEALKMNAARVKALDHYRKEGGEREKQRTEQLSKMQREVATAFESESKAGVEKYSKWFKPVEGDAKSAEILERGFHFADVAFGKADKDADGNVIRRAPAEMAKLHAAIRNKAGGFDHAIYLLNKERATVKQLQEKLKQYEDSGPGPGDGKGERGKPLTTEQQWERDLMARAK